MSENNEGSGESLLPGWYRRILSLRPGGQHAQTRKEELEEKYQKERLIAEAKADEDRRERERLKTAKDEAGQIQEVAPTTGDSTTPTINTQSDEGPPAQPAKDVNSRPYVPEGQRIITSDKVTKSSAVAYIGGDEPAKIPPPPLPPDTKEDARRKAAIQRAQISEVVPDQNTG